MSEDQMGGARKRRNRSPEHPALDLSNAIDRAEELYQAEGFHWVRPGVAVIHLGYKETSSTGHRILAALKHFGLLEDKGSGSERQVRLADLARRIIRDKREGSADRVRAIREAALSPSIYGELWERWGSSGTLPSRDNMEYTLEHELEFNPKAISGFIDDFVSTIEFAGLMNSDHHGGEEEEAVEGSRPQDTDPPRSRQRVPVSEAGQVPEISKPAPPTPDNVDVLELPIPLLSGVRARLIVPVPMTNADFALLRSTLMGTLDAMRPALVRETGDPGDESVRPTDGTTSHN